MRAMRALTLVWLFLSFSIAAQTQTALNACEPSAEVKQSLKLLNFGSGRLIEKAVQAKKPILEQLLQQYPDDLFVHMEARQTAISTAGQTVVMERYRRLAENRPNSLQYKYPYARVLVDIDTPKAMDYSSKWWLPIRCLRGLTWNLLGFTTEGNMPISLSFVPNWQSFMRYVPARLTGKLYLYYHSTAPRRWQSIMLLHFVGALRRRLIEMICAVPGKPFGTLSSKLSRSRARTFTQANLEGSRPTQRDAWGGRREVARLPRSRLQAGRQSRGSGSYRGRFTGTVPRKPTGKINSRPTLVAGTSLAEA
jgi:hypothetical protein